MEEEHGMPQYIRSPVSGGRRRPSVRAMLYGTSAYQTYHSHSRPSPDFSSSYSSSASYEHEPYGSTFSASNTSNTTSGHHYDARNAHVHVPSSSSFLEEEVILEEEINGREFLRELEEERENTTTSTHHQKREREKGSARKFFTPRKYNSKSIPTRNYTASNTANNNNYLPSFSSSSSSTITNTNTSLLTNNDNPSSLLLLSHSHNNHNHNYNYRDPDRYTTPTSSSSYSNSYTYASHSNNSHTTTTTTTTPTPSRVATTGYRYENKEYRNSWRDRRNKNNNSTTTTPPTSNTNNNNNNSDYGSARRRPTIDLPSPILPPKFEEESPPASEVSPVKLSYDRDSWFSEVSKDNEPEASGVSDFVLSEDDNDYRPSNFHASLNEQLARKISTCSAVSSASTSTPEGTTAATAVDAAPGSRSVSAAGSVAGGGHQRGRHQGGKSNSSTPASTIRSKKGGLSGGLKDSIHSPFHTLSKNSSNSSLAAPTTAKNLSRTVSAPLHLNQPPPPLPPPLSRPTTTTTAEDEAKPTPPPSRAGHKRANSANFSNRSIRREPSITFTFNNKEPEEKEREKEKKPSANELNNNNNSEELSQSKSLPSRSKDKKILPLPKRSKLPARFSSNGVAATNITAEEETPPPSLIYRQPSGPTEGKFKESNSSKSKSNSSSATNSNAVTPKSSNEKVNVQGKSKKSKEEKRERSKTKEQVKDREKEKKDKNERSLQSTTPTVIVEHIQTNFSASPSPNPSPYSSVRTPSIRFVPPIKMSKSRDRDLRIPSDEKYGVHLLEDDDDDPTIRANQRVSPLHMTQSNTADVKKERAEASGPNDDVFLNLARSNTGGSNSTNDVSARRRSRYVSMSQHRNQLNNELPRHSYQTSTPPSNRAAHNPYSPEDISPLSNSVQYQSTHFDDPDAEHSLAHRSSFIRRSLREKDSPLQNGHARSVSEAPRTPLTRYNNNLTNQRTIGSLVEQDRAAAAAAAATNGYNRVVNDGTESTVSTTAPSVMMWDELDELKSRIRRLEMTGGRTPTSPNGHQGTMSNSSSERPRTGTTAATTVSSSPHHHTSGTTQPTATTSTPNGGVAGAGAAGSTSPTAAIPSSAAVTLQNAINKAKTVLPLEISTALENASAEAMGLVQLANNTGYPSTTALVTDRQVRRKVESMCRSLTELCISLSDGRMPLTQEEEEQAPLRIAYHPQNISPDRPGEYRSPSTLGYRGGIDRDGAATPSSTSKIFPRFESRRGSILSNASNSPAMNHHRMDGRVDASPSPAPTQNRLGQRNSMILRNRSSTIALDDEMAVGDETITPSYRSLSRSQTESMRSGESPRASDFGGGLATQAPTPRLSNYNDRIHRAPSVAASDVSRGSNLSHRRHFSSAAPSQQASNNTASSTPARRFVDRNSLQQDIGQALSTNSSPGLSATTRAIAIDQIRRRDGSDVQQQQHQHQQQPGDEIYSTSVPRDERRLRDGGSIGRVGSVSNRRTMLNNATYRDSGVSMARDREPLAQRYR